MKPILIDLDGVLRINGKPAAGAREFLSHIVDNGIPACILSNTTKLPTGVIRQFFDDNSIDLGNIGLHTALSTTYDYVKSSYSTISLYCEDSAKQVFDDMPKSDTPQAMVIGDVGEGWGYELLNEMMNMALNGADIIAMQMNKYGKSDTGKLYMDAVDS